MIRPLLSAISFLTIFRVPESIHGDRAALARSTGWYPAVGLLIGGLAAAAYTWMPEFPPLPRAVLVVLLPVVLTRALHLDGFADVCDGLGVFGPVARRLEVMRDPRLGTFGVAGLAFNLLWRIAVLASPLAQPVVAVLAAPVLGRWAMVLALRLAPYGSGGKLAAAAVRPGLTALSAATLVLLLPVSGAPATVLPAIAATAVLAWQWTRFARSWFGALTGDSLGALNEIVELTVLGLFLHAPPA